MRARTWRRCGRRVRWRKRSASDLMMLGEGNCPARPRLSGFGERLEEDWEKVRIGGDGEWRLEVARNPLALVEKDLEGCRCGGAPRWESRARPGRGTLRRYGALLDQRQSRGTCGKSKAVRGGLACSRYAMVND